MTSFLNKKFSLILVILAALILATSISSVSASIASGNASINISYNQTALNDTADFLVGENKDFSVWVNLTNATPAPTTGFANGTWILRATHTSGDIIELNLPLQGVIYNAQCSKILF